MIGKMKRSLIACLLCFPVLTALPQDVTYSRDIAPIIRAKCAPCHKPGQSGPFSLMTYEDVAKRTSFIRDVVGRGYMPPWKADNHYMAFANDRSLSDKEKALIIQWIDNKAPRGNSPDTARLKEASIPGTSYYRQPDLVLKVADT